MGTMQCVHHSIFTCKFNFQTTFVSNVKYQYCENKAYQWWVKRHNFVVGNIDAHQHILNLVWIQEYCLCISFTFHYSCKASNRPQGSVEEVPYCINVFDIEVQGLQYQDFLLQADFVQFFMNTLVSSPATSPVYILHVSTCDNDQLSERDCKVGG